MVGLVVEAVEIVTDVKATVLVFKDVDGLVVVPIKRDLLDVVMTELVVAETVEVVVDTLVVTTEELERADDVFTEVLVVVAVLAVLNEEVDVAEDDRLGRGRVSPLRAFESAGAWLSPESHFFA